MRSLPSRVILVVGSSLSVLQIYLAIPLWPAEFLLKDQVLITWGVPCVVFAASPLLLLIFFLCV